MTYSISQLADLANVSRRTVRYYIRKGLLPPPHSKGRGAHYGEEHLRQLLHIKEQQLQGLSLSDIAPEASPPQPSALDPLPIEKWIRVLLCDGVELHFDESKLRPSQIQTIQKTIAILLPSLKETP